MYVIFYAFPVITKKTTIRKKLQTCLHDTFAFIHIVYYLLNAKTISVLLNMFSLIGGEPIPEVLLYRANPWRE